MHTAPHMGPSRVLRAMRCSFISTGTPRLSMDGNSLHHVTMCGLLSSSGITRLHRYYEAIRLPMFASSASPITVVGALSHPWKRTWGLPGCRVVLLSCMPWSRTPGRGHRLAICGGFRIGFHWSERVALSQRACFRGSIPSTFWLTAYMLAVLRMRSGITALPPRTRYPAAGQALPRRESHPLDNATLPGRTGRPGPP